MGSHDRELKGLALLEGLGYVGEYQICADLRCELRIIPRRIERFGPDGIYDDLRQEQWIGSLRLLPQACLGGLPSIILLMKPSALEDYHFILPGPAERPSLRNRLGKLVQCLIALAAGYMSSLNYRYHMLWGYLHPLH